MGRKTLYQRTGIWLVLVFGVLVMRMGGDSHAMTYEECLLEAIRMASPETPVESIRSQCSLETIRNADAAKKRGEGTMPESTEAETAPSVVEKRLAKETRTLDNPFALTSHRPNYVLPVTYSTSMNEKPSPGAETYSDNWELKFQISLKYRVLENLIRNNGNWYIAYTNQSWWQAYNGDESSPFREINHEPETWIQFDSGREIFGFSSAQLLFGAVHQSNGRGMPFSRSWNRLYVQMIGNIDNLVLSLKPWYRIPESESESPLDSYGDDNPDISRFMGYGEFRMVYTKNSRVFSLMFRNNLRTSENKGAVELGWSFPIFRKLRGYVQYFNGYGESLIDYDASVNRFGLGLMLSDWL